MVFDVAQQDAAIGLGDDPGDVHRGARRRRTEVHTVGGVAVHAADLGESPLACEPAPLLLGVDAVAAQREHQRDVRRGHARRVQLVEQRRHDLIRRHGAGDVAGDDRDLLAGMHDLAQQRRADGLRERAAHLGFAGQFVLHMRGLQDAQQVGVGDFERLGALPEAQLQPHPNLTAAWRSARTTGSSSPVRKRINAPPPVHR